MDQGHEDHKARAVLNGHPVPGHHRHTVSGVWRCLCSAVAGLGSLLIHVDPIRGLDLHRGQPEWPAADLLVGVGAICPLKSTDDGFHLRLQQHITSVVVARHQLWIATLVGVMLHREQFVSTFHLLLRESSGQRQAKALAGLDGVDIRVSPHWALFAAVVGFARLAFGTLLAG